MKKNVWWQTIKLFLEDLIKDLDIDLFPPYMVVMFIVGAITGLLVNKFLGFGGLTIFLFIFFHAPVILVIALLFRIHPFVIKDINTKIDSFYLTIECLKKYFPNLLTRAKQEVENIQEKEEKEKIERIKNCYKTLLDYWTSRLAEPEKLKVGEKEEIEEGIARTLRLENLSVDDFGIIIPSRNDSISEVLLAPEQNQQEKAEPETVHTQILPVHE